MSFNHTCIISKPIFISRAHKVIDCFLCYFSHNKYINNKILTSAILESATPTRKAIVTSQIYFAIFL